ncbi:hypothetical protein [Herbihabitans rhizosphaerae]|nr:hypothetical protein [Herbihabitans rhizosphaerae]
MSVFKTDKPRAGASTSAANAVPTEFLVRGKITKVVAQAGFAD